MNYIGISDTKLKKVAKHLNILLASYQVYYQNLRSFHWHIEGQNFFEMHRVFEELYNDAKVKIDEIAERLLTLHQKPLGSLSEYLNASKIDESKDAIKDERMVYATLQNHIILIEIMRKTIAEASKVSDEGTVDLIAGFLGEIEKKSWMLNAWKSHKFEQSVM